MVGKIDGRYVSVGATIANFGFGITVSRSTRHLEFFEMSVDPSQPLKRCIEIGSPLPEQDSTF
jgi:hypothetical protein